MILKVGRTNGGGWCFFSDIYELDSELIKYTEIEGAPNEFLFSERSEDNPIGILLNIDTHFIDRANMECLGREEGGEPSGLCRHIRFKSGGESSHKHIALDTDAFLLNNTGSTIERIN